MCLLSPDQNLNPKIQVLEINMSAIARFVWNTKKDFLGVQGLYFRSHSQRLDIALFILEFCLHASHPFSQGLYLIIFW